MVTHQQSVAWTQGGVDWGFRGQGERVVRLTAMSQLMTAIGIGWGISWLASLVMWVSPWAAVMFIHFWVVRRGRVDVDELCDPPHASRVGDVRWGAIVAFLAGVLAAWLFAYGLVAAFQGPLSKALNNVDISWLTGMLVAGSLYWVLEGRRACSARPVPAAAAVRA